MQRNDRTVRVEARLVPEPSDAVEQFESLGGHLTLFNPFGEDSLKDRADLISQRETDYFAQYPEFEPISTVLLMATVTCLDVVVCC